MDVFRFFLAEKLGRTVGELDVMGHDEYLGWAAYYTAKHACEDMRGVGPGA